MGSNPDGPFGRTELLVGEKGADRLAAASVIIFGIGGVGSYAAEAIGRASVGHITLVDFDTVEPSNINRQLLALHSTLGRAKVDVARARLLDINPDATVRTLNAFADEALITQLLDSKTHYVLDAIDSIDSKVALLLQSYTMGCPTVSCMGAANKLCPTGVRVADIGKTQYCPLARTIRQRLRKQGVTSGIRCVYTEETQRAPLPDPQQEGTKKRAQGSISFVPGIIGLTAAGVLINDILNVSEEA